MLNESVINMTEPLIRDYFLGKISAAELEKKSAEKSDGKMRAYYREVEAIENDEFIIKASNLIAVCNDVLEGRMQIKTVEELSFILLASDYFCWNIDTEEGERIENTLNEWNSPELFYPLTHKNIIQWKKYLSGQGRTMT